LLRIIIDGVLSRKWIVGAFVVIVTAAVYAASASLTKSYRSTALVELKGPNVSVTTFVPSVLFVQPPLETLSVATRLMKSSRVAAVAASQLTNPRTTGSALMSDISVSGDINGGFLSVTGSAGSAARSAAVANALANAFVAVRTRENQALVAAELASVIRQRAALPVGSAADRAALTTQIATFRTLIPAEAAQTDVLQRATPPASAYSPRPLRNTGLGFGAAIVVALLAVWALELRRASVSDPEQLERLVQEPVLGVLPKAAFEDPFSSTGAVTGAFDALRSSLDQLERARGAQIVLVTSPLDGDGKTTTAMGLAAAIARAGRDVVLVDADLRSRTASLALDRSAAPGLGEVIGGEMAAEAALSKIEQDGVQLRLLASGSAAEQPGESLRSTRAWDALTELAEIADVVIVDGPSLLSFPDVLPLLYHSLPVLLVTHRGVTPGAAVQLCVELVRAAGSSPLGTVVTGARVRGAAPEPALELERHPATTGVA
jgi:Mrp family chromosome partitioning ATPase